MMRLVIEKGKMCVAMWPWVHFTLCNPDITFALNRAPLQMKKTGAREFVGKAYFVSVRMRSVVDSKPDPKDEVHVITDVKMPLGLGSTYTVGDYKYCAADPSTTMLELNLILETSGPFMPLYFHVLKGRINAFINKVMSDNERASVLLQENDLALKDLLDDEQLARIKAFRSEWGHGAFIQQHNEHLACLRSPEDQQAWHPEIAELTGLFERIQGKATQIEQELIRIRETRDAVATLLVARRMLEVIVEQICEEKLHRPRGSEPLGGILGKIGHENAIPEYVLTSMENLNRLSTYGAHPKNFSLLQVREALLALCSIMEWYVSAELKPSQSSNCKR